MKQLWLVIVKDRCTRCMYNILANISYYQSTILLHQIKFHFTQAKSNIISVKSAFLISRLTQADILSWIHRNCIYFPLYFVAIKGDNPTWVKGGNPTWVMTVLHQQLN